MQKLILNQDVYILVECFLHGYGMRIVKCKVKGIPHASMREYKLAERGHLYWHERSQIYETKAEAVDAAEKWADEYDKTWAKYAHPVVRYWRGGDKE